jgi:hypothetical protein
VKTEKDAQVVDLLQHGLAWAGGEGSRLWVLLGDYGTGKTAFTRRFAHELAQQALGRTSAEATMPLLINLRDYPNKTSLGDILHEHWHRQTGERRDPAIFLQPAGTRPHRAAARQLRRDGHQPGAPQRRRTVPHAGAANRRCRRPGARQPRPRHLPRTVLPRTRRSAAGRAGARPTAWRRSNRRRAASTARSTCCSASATSRFASTCASGLAKTRAAGRGLAIDRLYNLKSLADRPQLLEMIIDSLPELLRAGQSVTPGALYLRYTNRWLDDPAIRPADRQSSSGELRGVLEALAVELWRRDGQRIHHADLYTLITRRGDLRGRHDPIVLDVELRTAAFLSRTADGYYGFSHRSFLEFFYARALLQALHAASDPQSGAQALAELLSGAAPESGTRRASLATCSPPRRHPPDPAFVRQSCACLLANPEQPPTARRNAYLPRLLAEPPRARQGRMARSRPDKATGCRSHRNASNSPAAAATTWRCRARCSPAPTSPTAPGIAATSAWPTCTAPAPNAPASGRAGWPPASSRVRGSRAPASATPTPPAAT